MCFMYVLAVLLPPAVPLFLGYGLKHTALNIVLCCFLWVPATIHAVLCIYDYNNHDRQQFGFYIGYDINE